MDIDEPTNWRVEPREAPPFVVAIPADLTPAMRGLIATGAAGLPEPGPHDPDMSVALAELEALGLPILRRWGRVVLAASVCRVSEVPIPGWDDGTA